MKRILTSLILGASLALISVLPASATHYWQIKSSEPKATSQLRTFTIDFVTLSAVKEDDFTVTLFENDVQEAVATTTKDYGDSGKFTVTVPADGTYKYHMVATNGEETKQTPDQNVTVNTQGTTTTVTVVPAPAGSTAATTGGGGTATGTGGGGGTGAAAGGATANTGEAIQGASTEQDGQVSTEASQTSATDEDGDVLGAEKAKDSDNTSDWVLWTLAALVLGALLYTQVYRAGRWPFHRD